MRPRPVKPVPPRPKGEGERPSRSGAGAFIRARSATDRLTIPASVLTDMVANASTDRVAYLLVIEEFRRDNDAVSGRLVSGEPFTLPFVQEGETTLLVSLER